MTIDVSNLVNETHVQLLAAHLEQARYTIESLAHDDGEPRFDWTQRINAAYRAYTRPEERPTDLKPVSVPHAVLAVMRMPKRQYGTRFSDGSESTYTAANPVELSVHIQRSAMEYRYGIYVQVTVNTTASNPAYGNGQLEVQGEQYPYEWWEKQDTKA